MNKAPCYSGVLSDFWSPKHEIKEIFLVYVLLNESRENSCCYSTEHLRTVVFFCFSAQAVLRASNSVMFLHVHVFLHVVTNKDFL